MPEVILSDGEPLEVRTLGIFELDVVERQHLGPYTYPIELLGDVVKYAEWDLSKYEELGRELPSKPKKPEHLIEEDTEEWYQLRDWKRYETALWHRKEQNEAAAQFAESVCAYILENCIPREAWNRIVTEGDWEKIYIAALVPPLTMQMIIDTLRDTYNASFDNKEIFEAMDKAKGGSGEYNHIRLWENQWATEMKLSDLELAMIPVEERSRRICAMMLNNWLEFLELDKSRKKRAASANH
jgi:hypothetical protein